MIKNKILPVMFAFLMILSMGAASAANSTFNTSSISDAGVNTKNYIEINKALPTTVNVSNQEITPSQFLYLLAQDVQNINKSSTAAITLKGVTAPSSPSETISTGSLTKTEYVSIANKITTFVNTYGRLPNYVTTSLGQMRYENLIYTYSKIMDFYKTNNRLPTTVSIKSWSSVISGGSTNITSGGTVNFTDTSHTTTVRLGNNSLGYVDKISSFGTGTIKVAVIIGVHAEEGAAHLAMLNALKTLASTLTNVKIDVFRVHVYDPSDYTTSRANGQTLANLFVVPNINTSYKLVIDVHGNRGNFATNDFIFAPSNGTKSVSYANKIVATTNYLKYWYLADGSSPKYVTLPIAAKGIPTVVYELYLNVNYYNVVLYNKCLQLVKGLNTITYS
jgi:hypothetical protein